MKKVVGIIVVLAIIVAGVLLVAPKFAGIAAARQIRLFVANATEESGVPMPTTIESGWFSSRVLSTVDVVQVMAKYMPSLPDTVMTALTPFMVCSSSEISHGPVPMGCAQPGGPQYAPALARVVQTSTIHLPSLLAGTSFVFTAYSTIGFDGVARIMADVPEFNVVMQGGITVTVGRIAGTATCSMDLKDIVSGNTMAPITIACPEATIAIGPIAAQCAMTRTPEMLRIGAQQCTIGAMSFATTSDDDDAEPTSVLVSDIAIVQTSRVDNGALAVSSAITVQKIVGDGETYGPAALRIAASGLDAAQLGMMRKELQSLSFDNKAPEEILPMLQQVLLTNLTRMIEKQPRIELNECSLKMPKGSFCLAASCIPRAKADAGTTMFDIGLSLSAPKTHGFTADGASTDVVHASGTLTVGKDLSKIGFSLAMPGLAVNTEDGALLVRGLDMSGDSIVASHGLRTGSQRLSLASLAFENEDNQFRLDGTKLSSGAGINDALLFVDVKACFDTFKTVRDTWGPGTINIAAKNLHAESIATLRAAFEDVKHARNKELASIALMGKIQQVLPVLIGAKPTITMPACSLKMPRGTVTLDASMTMAPMAGKPIALTNLHELLVAELHMAMPAALVDQPAGPGRPSPMAGIAAMMAKTNNMYRMDIESKGGMATFNGEEVPLDALMGLLTGQSGNGSRGGQLREDEDSGDEE